MQRGELGRRRLAQAVALSELLVFSQGRPHRRARRHGATAGELLPGSDDVDGGGDLHEEEETEEDTTDSVSEAGPERWAHAAAAEAQERPERRQRGNSAAGGTSRLGAAAGAAPAPEGLGSAAPRLGVRKRDVSAGGDPLFTNQSAARVCYVAATRCVADTSDCRNERSI